MTDIRELSINELDAVSGGMDCQTGIAIAQTFALAGQILGAFGNYEGAANMFGRSYGVSVGACGYAGPGH